jgi:Xaa-Pro aminopeptidase
MSIASLKAAMREQDACALVFSEENGFYFTSFASTNGVLLVTADRAVYFTDGRYLEAARQTIASFDDILDLQSFETSVKPLLVSLGVKKIMIEGERLSVARWQALKKALPDAVFDSEALDGIINGIRARKRGDEVEKIVKAQRIAEEALRLLLPQVKVGAVERELALELDTTMRRLGAQDVSFETILISGKETSKPHGVPSDKKIERGDFVTIDFGALYQGYHSDMTRTFAVCEVSDEMARIYDTVLQAQLAGLAALAPGKVCRDVDKVSRDLIAAAGFGDRFGHGLGHSVGVEIHEYPYLNPRCDAVLQPGNVVTVEPGIYIPGFCGVRIEDMALIMEAGFENLVVYPKELIVLP